MKSSSHLQKQLSGASQVTRSFGAMRVLKYQIWVWPVLVGALLVGVGWWVHRSVEKAMRDRLASDLMTILNADLEALRIWRRDQIAIARSLARKPELRPIVRELVAASASKDGLVKAVLQAKALGEARTILSPFVKDLGYYDFFLVAPSMRIVGSNTDAVIGNEIVGGHRRQFFEGVMTGAPGLSQPYRSPDMLPDGKGELKTGRPTMFTAAAIKDDQGKPIAVLALRIPPEETFTEILRTASFGTSGESYAFSSTGMLLSQSRFDDDLKRIGLLADLPDSQSILTVEVRDPQVNMMEGNRPPLNRADQPLTKLVANAIGGGGGLEMDPYNDYRGVPSIGASKWLPDYGIGVATEVDSSEAFYPLYVLRRAIYALFGLLSACSLAMLVGMIYLRHQRQRMQKAERTIKQLGQYTLEAKIGAGGMGSVYRASHAFLRRPTAVKMLEKSLAGPEGFARFEREVQITANLNHPNTIAVYDYGRTADDVFYYAMEFLDGINLEELVQTTGPLPDGRAINILQQICGSLAEAHDNCLIHRDVKPANIILTHRAGIPDFVKVLDFGLVKAADATEDAKLTQVNVTVGTPNYISPEAVDNPEKVTAKSDLYAIGAVGYFLVTGTPVFTGKTVMDICMKHVRAIPDPISKRLGSEISPRLEALILHCLAKAPDDRPGHARAIMEELAQCVPLQPWTREDADLWWKSFRESSKPAASSPETLSGGTTRGSMKVS